MNNFLVYISLMQLKKLVCKRSKEIVFIIFLKNKSIEMDS